MPKVKLTDAAVQRLHAPPGARVEYFDATLPGFGLRVSGPTARAKEGRKSWVLLYRFGGEQRRLTLEPGYPALGLAEARRKAGNALAVVAEGRDPAAEREQKRAVAARRPDTVRLVVDEYLKRGLTAKRRAPRYVEEVRRTFTLHVLPLWGERDIKAITRKDVITLLDAIADGTTTTSATGRVRGGPIAANRTLAAVRALFNWALRRGVIEATPTSLVERPGEETRRERALAADELRAVWAAAGQLGYPFGSFFKVALLTAQRRDEVAGMRWTDVDLAACTWTLAAAATKAKRTHTVPLSSAALELLGSLPRIGTGGFVFTTAGRTAISGFSVAKRQLDTKAAAVRAADELPAIEPWRVHDLRRTAATGMGALGHTRFIIGRVLNHADPSVTGIYDRHSYLEEKRAALEAWAQRVEAIVAIAGDRDEAMRAAG